MNYCYKCGEKLILKENFNCNVYEGLVPYCENCKEFRFPFFNVAVSMVIFNKDYSKTLLIKQYGRDFNILVAGYVEIKEEVGLKVSKIFFNASRYYEKSNSLICNFIVSVEDENFKLNPEVDFAKWYFLDEAKEAILKNGLAEAFFLISLEKIKQKNSPLFV